MWFVAAKDLETRLLDVYPSNLFFVIDEDRKLYKLFQPSNANDFNEKQRYGQKHGKYCVLFHILALSEDETELNARVTNRKHPKKIHNPNRLSASIPKILWASLRPWVCVEEAKDETKTALKNARDLGKAANEEAIFGAKNGCEPQKRSSEKVLCDNTSDNVLKKLKTIANGNLESNLAADIISGSSPKSVTLQESVCNSTTSKDKSKAGKPSSSGKLDKNVSSEINQPPASSSSSAALDMETQQCTGNCTFSTYLQGEVLRYKKELDTERAKREEESKRHKKELEVERAKWKDRLEKKSSAPAVNLGFGMRGLSTMTDEEIQGLGVLCPDLPNGKIHMGSNVFADIERVKTIESTSFDFSQRLTDLFIAVFPEDYNIRALDPKRVTTVGNTEELKTITQENTHVMSKLLKKMIWDEKEVKCGNEHIREQLRRIINRLREKQQFSTLDPLEQQRILSDRKAKAKEYRDRAKNRKGGVPPAPTKSNGEKSNKKKNGKGNKKTQLKIKKVRAITSSDSENNEDSTDDPESENGPLGVAESDTDD